MDVLLGVIAFALTWAMVVVATVGGRADRQSTYCKTSRKSNEAALWEGVYEALIYADMYLVVRQAPWLAVPVITAAICARRWALEKRRRKWWANAGKRAARKQRKLDNPTTS